MGVTATRGVFLVLATAAVALSGCFEEAGSIQIASTNDTGENISWVDGASPSPSPAENTDTGPAYTFDNPQTTTDDPVSTPSTTTPSHNPTTNDTLSEPPPSYTIPDYDARDPYDVDEPIPVGVQTCDRNETLPGGVDLTHNGFAWQDSFNVRFNLTGFGAPGNPALDDRAECAGWLFRVWAFDGPGATRLYYQYAGTGLVNRLIQVHFEEVQAYSFQLLATDGYNDRTDGSIVYPPAPHAMKSYTGSFTTGMNPPSHTFSVTHKFHDQLELRLTQSSTSGTVEADLYAPDGSYVASTRAGGSSPGRFVGADDASQTGTWRINIVSSNPVVGVNYDVRVYFTVPYAYQ